MTAKRIIPCLDVRNGRVVKGIKFLNLRDAGDPASSAEQYGREGADEVVFLDITASAEGRKTMIDVVQKTAERLFVPLTVGGGISSVEDVRNLLRAGADKVSINTAAVQNPGLIQEASKIFGSQCIVLAVDARRVSSTNPAANSSTEAGTSSSTGPKASPSTSLGAKWEVVIHGGRTPTGKDAIEWMVEAVRLGAGEILLTSMDRDGTLDGYDLELIQKVSQLLIVPVIASGGAGNPGHMADALEAGAEAALAASIYHDGTYSIKETKEVLAKRGIPVRL